MARQTRHATESSGDGAYAGIISQGYVSDYFLAYRLDAGLADLYAKWEELERNGDRTPRTAVRSLSGAMSKYRPDAASTGTDAILIDSELIDTSRDDETPIDIATLGSEAIDAQLALNDAVLAALGWAPEHCTVTLMSGGTAVDVPVLHRRDTASGLLLVALGGVFATDPAAVAGSKHAPAGTLLDPIRSGDRVLARTVLEAAQVIFTAENAPTYVLVCSGGAVTLLDRDRWGEGVLLGANIDDAVARADHRSKGELAAIAALLSADAIDPGSDAQSPLAALLDKAANESAGVSKELRHGMRRSVELLAAAVVDDIRHRQKKNWEGIDAEELTRQSLRYLYRIIVLLFAEARPELGILPVDDSDYQAGYSIARLRDTALVELHGERAANATHIQESLAVLFSLVDEGYEPPPALGDVRSITFPGLRSKLFGSDACPMLDRSRLPDTVTQQVLANLCFTREQSGKQRQSLSYATLGINQLGAVYEGLMAYRGFLATEPLYEVDNDGDQDTGTWVIPVSRADEYSAELFVTEPGPDNQPRRVTYEVGDFVFRLAGRDRQRSASFYTPEVLTEFTVRHALDVYVEEHPDMVAGDWLGVTVCEPALGSGAFANEAVNQLAARYLKAAQQAAGETIDPDQYQHELQKAKAHFAINRTYGVDLNRTAVELAEVSLWLNVMHDGLSAPRFDARLRRGNSLIGARRSTYTAEQVAKAPWKARSGNPVVAPTDHMLSEHPLGSEVGIHHFLVPGEGWGCAATAVELKGKGGKKPVLGLAEEWSEQVRDWSKEALKAPTKAQIERLKALSRRVEHAWAEAANHAGEYLRAHERHIDVWGAEKSLLPPTDVKATGLRFLDPEGPAGRLRLLMDAWCGLWLWAPADGTTLPTFAQWLDAAELLLGQPDPTETGELFGSYETQDGTLESVEIFGKARVAEILDRYPWLSRCQRIAEVQAFFHWELDFGPLFTFGGGFDLQVGNPPWVRPTWDEPASLAEYDPWWAITDLTKVGEHPKKARRQQTLGGDAAVAALIRDHAENQGTNELLAAGTREPLLLGMQTNLYLNFMTSSWRRLGLAGVVGLLHPESHFVDPKGGLLRTAAYRRLRRHWQFENKLFLFAEVHDNAVYALHIYGPNRTPNFIQASNLLHPVIVDRSLAHDGSGDLPGIQYPDGAWDLRPHAQRIVPVTLAVLHEWVQLFDEPGTPPEQARLLRPLTTADLEALSVLARQPQQLGQITRHWTSGFHEKGGKDDGTFEWRTEVPSELSDCILQGPHVLNATPFAQQPKTDLKSKTDWVGLNIENLPLDFVPRSNYQRVVSSDVFVPRQSRWGDLPYTSRYREVHREFVDRAGARTLQSCIIPPGVPHLYTLISVELNDARSTALLSALFSSLPYDYLTKVFGASHLTRSLTDVMPIPPENQAAETSLLLRVLRLNCLTSAYSQLWEELYEPDWVHDRFEARDGKVDLGEVRPEWTETTPLRTDLDRWLALCEIDALVAMLTGLSQLQLVQMFRSRFAVLRKNEYVTVFDGNGRQISGIHHNYGFHQAEWEAELKSAPSRRGEKRIGMWNRVQAHLAGETDVDLGPFVPPFAPADREAAMSKAYRAFEARLADA